MVTLIDRLLGRWRGQSAQVAKQRLQLVLVHDRSNLSGEKLSRLKDEMIDLISHYVQIDRRQVKVYVEHERRASWLVANIPLATDHRPRR
jgi:cell division topological specificity factor